MSHSVLRVNDQSSPDHFSNSSLLSKIIYRMEDPSWLSERQMAVDHFIPYICNQVPLCHKITDCTADAALLSYYEATRARYMCPSVALRSCRRLPSEGLFKLKEIFYIPKQSEQTHCTIVRLMTSFHDLFVHAFITFRVSLLYQNPAEGVMM